MEAPTTVDTAPITGGVAPRGRGSMIRGSFERGRGRGMGRGHFNSVGMSGYQVRGGYPPRGGLSGGPMGYPPRGGFGPRPPMRGMPGMGGPGGYQGRGGFAPRGGPLMRGTGRMPMYNLRKF